MTVVINHPENGVFVGVAMNMAFFTALDCAGQFQVCAFADEAEARDFAGNILAQGMDVSELSYVEVGTEKHYATAHDLLRVGLTDAANALMREKLEMAEPTGLAM